MSHFRAGMLALALCAGAVPCIAQQAGVAEAPAVSASAPESKPAPTKSSVDPLEGWNRAMFSFNEAVDAAILKPIAKGYQAVVPELARTGISNVFGNIGDVWSALNNLLQGKGEAAATMTMRVATNTVFGLGGLLDVATEMGMERQREDFGQTLGRWGVPAGPYLVLPLLGPSSLRDTSALPLELASGTSAIVDHKPTSYALTALQLVDTRAQLLGASKVLDDIALDKYSFMRDAYLTRRRNLVYDGDPPPLPEVDDEPVPSK